MNPPGSGCDVDIEITILNAQGVPRHRRRNSWLCFPGQAMKHPVVPRADDIIVFEGALAQWPAGMIATAGDCPELAIAVRESNEPMADFKLLEIASFQIFDGAQPLPVLICLMHHLNLLWRSQETGPAQRTVQQTERRVAT
jgi:hypothetical protein